MTIMPIANKIFFFMAAPDDRLCLEWSWIAIDYLLLALFRRLAHDQNFVNVGQHVASYGALS
jgi:hypothetical protein